MLPEACTVEGCKGRITVRVGGFHGRQPWRAFCAEHAVEGCKDTAGGAVYHLAQPACAAPRVRVRSQPVAGT